MKSRLLLVALTLVLSTFSPAQNTAPNPIPNTIFAGADGKFETAPDTALIQFNISAQAESAKDAYDQASTQAENTRQVLRANGIDPTSIIKSVTDILERVRGDAFGSEGNLAGLPPVGGSRRQKGSRERGGLDARSAAAEMAHAIGPDADELSSLIHRLDAEMVKAAEGLRFEEAALIRDEVAELRALLARDPVDGSPVLPGSTADVEAPAPA